MQVYLHLHRHVAARGRAGGAAAAAAERVTTEEGAEEVGEISETVVSLTAAVRSAQSFVTVGVVGAALLRVAQHLVGLGGFLELLFGLGVVVVDVGV